MFSLHLDYLCRWSFWRGLEVNFFRGQPFNLIAVEVSSKVFCSSLELSTSFLVLVRPQHLDKN